MFKKRVVTFAFLGVILGLLSACNSGNVRVTPSLTISTDHIGRYHSNHRPYRNYHNTKRCHNHPRRNMRHCH